MENRTTSSRAAAESEIRKKVRAGRVCRAVPDPAFLEKAEVAQKPGPVQFGTRAHTAKPARRAKAGIVRQVNSQIQTFHGCMMMETLRQDQRFPTTGSPPVALWGRCPVRRLQAPAERPGWKTASPCGVKKPPLAAPGAVCPRQRHGAAPEDISRR